MATLLSFFLALTAWGLFTAQQNRAPLAESLLKDWQFGLPAMPTDTNGTVSFRGFAGEYKIKYLGNDQTIRTQTIRLANQTANQVTVN